MLNFGSPAIKMRLYQLSFALVFVGIAREYRCEFWSGRGQKGGVGDPVSTSRPTYRGGGRDVIGPLLRMLLAAAKII